jgi:hypothetical protein
MPERKVMIMDRWWRFVLTKDLPKDLDGLTDPPKRKNKRVQVHGELQGERFLEIVLHETHHAGNDSIAEEYVEQIAEDQASIFCQQDCIDRFVACPVIRDMIFKAFKLKDPEEGK